MACKFTPEARGALLERFAAGCSIPDAATSCGLNQQTVKRWLMRGRKDTTGPYFEFVVAVDAARKDAKARPDAMDEDELARTVSAAARKGNTQAMKLRWEMLLAQRRADAEPEEPADPLAEFDELADRRARSAAV